LKYLLIGVVAIGFSVAYAGSYDDFFAAIRQDDPATIKSLLNRGFDPNTLSSGKTDPLYIALRDGSLKAAQALIDWPKTKVDERTPQDETPLMMACLRGNEELARKLIARGADVVKPGWAPLHYAATSGHVGIIRMLLEEHAYIDAESPNGTTPLMMAAQYGTAAAVKLLLDEGADPTLKNQLGMTALDFAGRGGPKEAAEMLRAATKTWKEKNGK
jgi:hypothetical protein